MRNKKFVVIAILAIVLVLLINFPLNNLVLYNVRNVLGILFIIFFPGYLLVALLFRKEFDKIDTLELIVLGIGLSIAIVILSSMILHFLTVDITAVNILNPVLTVAFVLGIANFFLVNSRKNVFTKDRNFFFLIILTLAVLAGSVFISATFSSKEEFIEIYWKISQIKNLRNDSQIICKIGNCSLSGISRIGYIDMAGEKFNTVIMDMKESSKYDYFCIDTNSNNIYCEETEGPFRANDSFLINGNGFNVRNVNENNLMLMNYPKEINDSTFNVGFIAKSYYRAPVKLNISLLVNDTVQESKTIALNPNQETLEYFHVDLQGKGLYRIRVASLPMTLDKRIYIDFWVNKN